MRRFILLFSLVFSSCAAHVLAATPSDSEPKDPFRPAAITTQNVPPVPGGIVERLRATQKVRTAGFRGWAPDGRGMLVRTRFGNTYQLHRVYEPGGRREQVTFFFEPADGTFVPKSTDGDLLVITSYGGDENYQIHRQSGRSGETAMLTDGFSRHLLGPLSRDGRQMIVSSNARNGRDIDIYLADTADPKSSRMLLQTSGEYWATGDFSDDGSKLLLRRYVSINESYPALLDVASRQLKLLPIPGGAPAAFGAMAFSPDAAYAWIVTDMFGEFRQLARLDLQTMRYELVTADIEADIDAITVEPDRGRVAFTVNDDGASTLYLLDETGRRRIDLPLGVISNIDFSPDGSQLGFSFIRAELPPDAYSLRLSDGELIRWTYSEVGGQDVSHFVAPQRIRYRSFDGRTIPAYVFKPRGASMERPAPVLIDIHGGPESQYRPHFSAIEQFMINELGLATIHPNVRGSDGYGKTYLKLDNGMLREDSVRDIGALLDWIAEQPELDASRIAVRGASYGGFMVLSSLIHYGDRLRAGIDLVGIANFNTFLENTSAYRRDLRRAEYGDERDPAMRAFFDRINPTANADKIRSALLIAHGVNDPRVPFSEAKQIAEEVRAAGREVWTIYADNEGHGFQYGDNRDYIDEVIVMFLQKHLDLSHER